MNAGLTGSKTDVIVGEVPGWLERFRPHVVVAMMGVNDRGEHVERPTGAIARLGELVRDLRVYKLYALLADHLRNRLGERTTAPPAASGARAAQGERPRGEPRPVLDATFAGRQVAEARKAFERGNTALAYRMVDDLLEAEPSNVWVLGALRDFEEQKPRRGYDARFRRAERTLRTHHALAPSDVAAAQRLMELYIVWGKPDRAREVILGSPGGAAIRPADRLLVVRQFWRRAIALENEGRVDEARDALGKALELAAPDDAYERARLLAQLARLERRAGDDTSAARLKEEVTALRAAGYTERTRDNYRKLHRLLAERGVRLVAMQYPVRPLEPLRDMLGDPSDVLFLSNEQAFQDALRERPYEELFYDSFAGDFGHATAAGNEVLARNVARVLREELLARAH
jgi:tetratricopeptide (TPR) repeat protein